GSGRVPRAVLTRARTSARSAYTRTVLMSSRPFASRYRRGGRRGGVPAAGPAVPAARRRLSGVTTIRRHGSSASGWFGGPGGGVANATTTGSPVRGYRNRRGTVCPPADLYTVGAFGHPAHTPGSFAFRPATD